MIIWTLELGRYNWAGTEEEWCLSLHEIDAAWLDQKIRQAEGRLHILRRNRAVLDEEKADA